MALIFDRSDGAGLPPVNGLRQLLTRLDRLPITRPPVHQPAIPVQPPGHEHRPVLLVSQIGEPVQPHFVGPGDGVVLLDELQVILENPETQLLLAVLGDAIVGLSVLREPRFVQRPQNLVGGGGAHGLLLVERDYGHVEGGGEKDEREKEGGESEFERRSHCWRRG